MKEKEKNKIRRKDEIRLIPASEYAFLALKELAEENHSSIEEELEEAVEIYYNWIKFQMIPIHFEWIGRGQYFTILVPPELTSEIMEVCAEENLHPNELVLNALKEYLAVLRGGIR